METIRLLYDRKLPRERIKRLRRGAACDAQRRKGGTVMLFKREDINAGVEECRGTPGAVLLDVREAEEFCGGHIPDAVNLPLSRIGETDLDRNTPLFVYCLRGTRSRRAAGELRRRGYRSVKSIGGIVRYRGGLER